MSNKIENKGTIGSLNLLFDLWPFLKPYKLWMGSALLALLLTTVINVAIGQGVKFVIDKGIAEHSIVQFNRAIGIMILLVSLQALGTFTRFYLVTTLGERVTADIRKKVFNHIVTLHPSYFEENRSGEIVSRLTTDTTLLQSIIGASLSMALRSGLMVIAGFVMLLVTNTTLTLIVLDQGKIVAQGTHSELITRSKLYQRLAELQFTSD